MRLEGNYRGSLLLCCLRRLRGDLLHVPLSVRLLLSVVVLLPFSVVLLLPFVRRRHSVIAILLLHVVFLLLFSRPQYFSVAVRTKRSSNT